MRSKGKGRTIGKGGSEKLRDIKGIRGGGNASAVASVSAKSSFWARASKGTGTGSNFPRIFHIVQSQTFERFYKFTFVIHTIGFASPTIK